MNKTISHRALLEDVFSSELYSQLKADTFDFWETFYRHNNYFLERNVPLLNRLKSNSNFEHASGMNDHSVGFENFIEFYDQVHNTLSSIGVRVCSLIDIIRMMKAMGLTLLAINKTVKGLAEKFRVELEIVERVFKASEDNISLLVHKTEERGLWDRKDVFRKLFEFLPSKDCLEVVLVNKEHYYALKESWIGSKLRNFDSLMKNQALRLDMWYSLVFPVMSCLLGTEEQKIPALGCCHCRRQTPVYFV